MSQVISIIKIGGNVIDDEQALHSFLVKFHSISGPKILVHGGGKLASRMADRLGIETRMVDGRRITDDQTIDIVTMTYAGLVNKHIVAQLTALGCTAMGMCGADGNAIPAHLRPKQPIDFGWVGDVNPAELNTTLISTLLNAGVTPVFCAITHDGEGHLLNTNADSVATALAQACSGMGRTRLVFCLEKNGVLLDIDDPSSLISHINAESFERLRAEGVINKGMLPKIEGALKAVQGGVGEVVIKHADNLLLPIGTTIRN